MSKTHKRLSVEAQKKVFGWVLNLLDESGS